MRVWSKEEIKNLILTNDKMVALSLKKLYAYQTESERNCGETTESNGVGFNGVDAPILTSFAMFYMERGFLSPKQVAIARKKLVKYSGQLTTIANNEQGA